MIVEEPRTSPAGIVLVVVVKCSTRIEARKYIMPEEYSTRFELVDRIYESISGDKEFPYFRVIQRKL